MFSFTTACGVVNVINFIFLSSLSVSSVSASVTTTPSANVYFPLASKLPLSSNSIFLNCQGASPSDKIGI